MDTCLLKLTLKKWISQSPMNNSAARASQESAPSDYWLSMTLFMVLNPDRHSLVDLGVPMNSCEHAVRYFNLTVRFCFMVIQ